MALLVGEGKLIVNMYNFWVVLFVALGVLSTAYGLAIIGSTVGQPNFYEYFNLAPAGEPGYDHTTNIIGALNGVNSAGAVAGCFLSAWTADKYSRKRTIELGCVILIIGGALCAGSVDLAMFLVGRIVAGLGAGILACVVPIYQSEVSTPETRGAMVCVTGIMYAYGYSLAGWLGFACYFIPGDSPHAQAAWRFPLAFQCVAPIIVLAGSAKIPYSPRWLLSQGRRAEALQVVKNLHYSPNDPEHTHAREEFYLMEKQFELDSQLPRRNFEIFRTKANIKRSFISFLLMWGDQFLGIFVMTNYGVLIYSGLGLAGFRPLLLNACWTTFTIIGNTVTALTVDRFGRRTFMLIGSNGCLMCLIFLAALVASFLNTDNKAGLDAAVFFIFFYIFWWCFFIDATQYVYLAEIWPNHLRSWGVAWGLSAFYLASEVCLVGAPVALNRIGWKFYLVLIVPSAVYITLIYFLFPETRQRTLEEIGELFGDKVAAHYFGSTEEEKEMVRREALKMTATGEILHSGSHTPSSGDETAAADKAATTQKEQV